MLVFVWHYKGEPDASMISLHLILVNNKLRYIIDIIMFKSLSSVLFGKTMANLCSVSVCNGRNVTVPHSDTRDVTVSPKKEVCLQRQTFSTSKFSGVCKILCIRRDYTVV